MQSCLLTLWTIWNPLILEDFLVAFDIISEKLKKRFLNMLPQWKAFHQMIFPNHGEYIWKRSYSELQLYISEKIKDGSQTLLSPEERMKLESFLLGLHPVSQLLPVKFLDGANTRTSFTTAPMEAAGVAGGSTQPCLNDLDASWEEFMLETSNPDIGKIPSYISIFKKGWRWKIFSLEEKGSPLRVKIVQYDTTDLDSPHNWWKTKTREMDVPYVPKSGMEKTLHMVFRETWNDLKHRGANLTYIWN